jgi:tetraacyldisaccharide 4'-kinase
MREPAFWWRKPGATAALLVPLAAAYGAIAARRMARRGTRAGLPVLCVGNFTLGGSGKTPTAIAIAKLLQAAGEKPFCLSRGYSGELAGPVQVNVQTHQAVDVGDEALLLAHAAPTIVARDRVAGAQAAHVAGASIVVMDDGLQNGSIAKDLTIAVVDGRRGIGNGKVFPAGPLRATVAAQLKHTDALLVIGNGAANIATDAMPVFHGRLVPDPAAVAAMTARRVLAFAGIGVPEKFFATVTEAGIEIAERKAFADHHRYSGEEAAELVMLSERDGLSLLTTEKDHARMRRDPSLAALAARARVLPVTLQIDENEELRRLLGKLSPTLRM